MKEKVYFFEKVNPNHPDKIADRLGGKCVDLAYEIMESPKIAGECLIGHEECDIIIETDLPIFIEDTIRVNDCNLEGDLPNIRKYLQKWGGDGVIDTLIDSMVEEDYFKASKRLLSCVFDTAKKTPKKKVQTEGYFYYFTQSIMLWLKTNAKTIKDITIKIVKQDSLLNSNATQWRVGDNGIFKGVPTNKSEKILTNAIYDFWKGAGKTDGKGLVKTTDPNDNGLLHFDIEINQSNLEKAKPFVDFEIEEQKRNLNIDSLIVNPRGNWIGGLNVDSGACNRKLGSDMGRAVTGGGLHFKDLSKGDVSINIFCHLLAMENNKEVNARAVFGDKDVEFFIGEKTFIYSFKDIIHFAKEYIDEMGGFEKLAEWGFIRPTKETVSLPLWLDSKGEENCDSCKN